MKPTRLTQPYRKTRPREPGAALTAMTRGRSASGYNPADITRAAQGLVAAGRKPPKKRPDRPARPARPQRPPR